MSQQLPVKETAQFLRITGSQQLGTLSGQISEVEAVLRIANWPPFRERAIQYWQLVKLAEDPKVSSDLRALYVKEANETLERDYPEGRKRKALAHVINAEENKQDPYHQKQRELRLSLAKQTAKMAELETDGYLGWEKDDYEETADELRELAAKGWNLARTRNCEFCKKHFQFKRTDQLFCSTNCRVKNWQADRNGGPEE